VETVFVYYTKIRGGVSGKTATKKLGASAELLL